VAELLCFRPRMLVTPQGFFRSFPIVNVEVYPDPILKRPIACAEGGEATVEPAVFFFTVPYSESRLAAIPFLSEAAPTLTNSAGNSPTFRPGMKGGNFIST
jgi:hypothetical protein